MMVENLDSMLMYVETAFEYRELDEEMFVKNPVGLNEVYPNSTNVESSCLLLKMVIY